MIRGSFMRSLRWVRIGGLLDLGFALGLSVGRYFVVIMSMFEMYEGSEFFYGLRA